MTLSRPRRIAGKADRRVAGIAILIFAGLCMALAPNLAANADELVHGSAYDQDTNEPIEGAWIFETERRPRAASDVERLGRVRMTRSDARGRFSFDERAIGFWDRLLGRYDEPNYAFYHPSYGLLRVRATDTGQRVTLRPTLRDAHLRQADASAFCNQVATDEMSRKMREVACPPHRVERFEGGSPRATGSLDDRGRRHGPWTFFRVDGSVIAWGEYRNGGAIGAWRYEPADSTTPNQD